MTDMSCKYLLSGVLHPAPIPIAQPNLSEFSLTRGMLPGRLAQGTPVPTTGRRGLNFQSAGAAVPLNGLSLENANQVRYTTTQKQLSDKVWAPLRGVPEGRE